MGLSVSDALYGALVDLGYTGSISDLQYAMLTDETPPGGGSGASVVDSIADGDTTNAPSGNAVFDALALKAPLASPAFTGNPTAPTPSTSDNDTSIATTAFVQAVVTALINGAPGALDTLDELAAAFGDDANFATTVTNALALKAPLASPTFTGTTYISKGLRKAPQSKTAAFTIALGDEDTYLCAPAVSFAVTLPGTTQPGHIFTIRKTDTDTTKTITLTGTFNDGGVTNFILRGLGQWVTFMTTAVSGTFQVLAASPCAVPTGTAHAGLTDGIQFVEYTP